jgi:hypothetical protein
MATQQRDLRKRILNTDESPASGHDKAALDIAAIATVIVTSEETANPVNHIFDQSHGPGATRWVAAKVGEQDLIVDFDTPQTINRIVLEVEETEVSRRQEVVISISRDGGHGYDELIRQEYNFSPPGTTFERETWMVSAQRVTHLRLHIIPDKGGKPCRATVTSLVLYGSNAQETPARDP